MDFARRAAGSLLAFASLGLGASAAAADVLRVEFLYSIEHARGRAERLREPLDLSLDRKTGELYVLTSRGGVACPHRQSLRPQRAVTEATTRRKTIQ